MLFIGAASARSVKGDAPRADCNQAAYDRIGPDCFFLDLRKAPRSGPVWVDGDGCFRWDEWSAILEFHHGADAGRITITMPGMGTYHGVRAEHLDESLALPV